MDETAPQPAPQPQVTTTKSHDWKKVSLTVLVILVVAGLLIAAYWFLVLNKSSDNSDLTGPVPKVTTKTSTESAKESTPLAEKDETASWETYISTRDGYSIKYPQDWIVIPEKPADGPYIRNFDPSSKPAENPPTINYPKGYINLRVLKEGPNSQDRDTTAIDFYNNLKPNGIGDDAGTYVLNTVENYEVNGYKGKKVKSVFDETNTVIILPKNPNIYKILIYPYESTENKTVQTILSTFKFLD